MHSNESKEGGASSPDLKVGASAPHEGEILIDKAQTEGYTERNTPGGLCYRLGCVKGGDEKNMESLDKLTTLKRELHSSFASALESSNEDITRYMSVSHGEVAAQALKELWQELEPGKEPLIFMSPGNGRMQSEHHPVLLANLLADATRPQHPPSRHLH